MELPNRKKNRLDDFDYSAPFAYFVTLCTQDKKKILSDIVGDGFPVPKPCGIIAEEMIAEIPRKYPCVHVDKYVIMPNHIHMLLKIDGTGNPSPTLGNVIGWYKYQATKKINLSLQVSGERVFQRSYYDHVVRNEQDYLEIWNYIEGNASEWVAQRHINNGTGNPSPTAEG